jgi:hypothetical protein
VSLRASLAVFAAQLLACASDVPPPEIAPPPPPDPGPLILPANPLVMATAPPPDQAPLVDPGADCAIRLARPPRAGCNAIFALSSQASSAQPDAAKAADGSTCTVWNAGAGAPQTITFDLGTPTRIDVVALVPEMTPDGQVAHEVAFSDDGRSFQVGHRVEAPMRSGAQVELVLPRPERARFVRVTSSRSPSFVAWREIGLFRCGTE